MSEPAKTTGELRLNDPQRRAVGVRLRAIEEAVQQLRRAGFDPALLDSIGGLAHDAADAAHVTPPLPQPSLVRSLIAEILIDAAETGSRGLRRYGELDDEATAWLQHLSARLTELAEHLG